jgi:arylsulfatase A-like enzyme
VVHARVLRGGEGGDDRIGRIVATVAAVGLHDPVFVITSDHGAYVQYSWHGGYDSANRDIPLFFFGSGIKRGWELTDKVSTMDTAPTVLRLLGVSTPGVWKGHSLDVFV